ncbi:PqqD family protein [Desulfobacter postgatei]|uniref:PqqD family protein n=1 Tax=Desulfobacter postgatei TaxID=2293 RepID=UPI00259AF926|nr:PqqD family protein [uncultured Desulfobacter sp.]
MSKIIHLDKKYIHSENVIFKEIEDELVIVPFSEGIGKIDEAVYSLNKIGHEIWNRLSGEYRLAEVIDQLAELYEGRREIIENDVILLLQDLIQRGFVLEKG